MMDGDQSRLQEYLRRQLPDREDLVISDMTTMLRGASNETYQFSIEYRRDGRACSEQYVLRPQKSEGILEPYDVSRQYRVMAALQGSAVPVPRLLCLEETGRVLGAPFYVMECVDAEAPPLLWQSEAGDARMVSHARALRAIHDVDWRALDLGFLGEPADAREAVDLEIDAWLARHGRGDGGVHPRLAWLAEWLRENNPGRGDAVLNHGDTNPGNYLFRGDEVVGVVDWEMAVISDPRSDLGFYAAIQSLFGGFIGAELEPGFIAAYEEAAGVAVEDMDYFEALGLFKMAAVILRAAVQWAPLRPFLHEALERRLTELLGDVGE